MTIRRKSSTDTLNKSLSVQCNLNTTDSVLTNGYRNDILLSCRINAYSSPPHITTELVPLITPQRQLMRTHVTDDELYFLQWVFSGLFSDLNAIIDRDHPGYKILRPEIEPGISWDDFRTERRSLLLWLTRGTPYDSPVEYLVDYCRSKSSDDNRAKAEWVKYGVFVGTMAKQMQLLKKQLEEFRSQMTTTEKGLDDIWDIISASYPTTEATSSKTTSIGVGNSSGAGPVPVVTKSTASSPALPPPNNDGAEWSVVEDDDADDDREGLTSASLSGYEDYEDSDM